VEWVREDFALYIRVKEKENRKKKVTGASNNKI